MVQSCIICPDKMSEGTESHLLSIDQYNLSPRATNLYLYTSKV